MKKEKITLCEKCKKHAYKGFTLCNKHLADFYIDKCSQLNSNINSLKYELQEHKKVAENIESTLRSERINNSYLNGKLDGIKLATGLKEEFNIGRIG